MSERIGLPVVEPLPGGERRLREALRTRRPRWRVRPAFAVAAMAAAVAIASVAWPTAARPDVDASLRAAWEAPQPVEVGHGAAEVVVDTAQVRVVLIARVDAMPRE